MKRCGNGRRKGEKGNGSYLKGVFKEEEVWQKQETRWRVGDLEMGGGEGNEWGGWLYA